MRYVGCHAMPIVVFLFYAAGQFVIALYLQSILGPDWSFAACCRLISLRNAVPIPSELTSEKQSLIVYLRIFSGITFAIFLLSILFAGRFARSLIDC